MNYEKIIEQAKIHGLANDRQSAVATKKLSSDLMKVKDIDEGLYHEILLDQHEAFFGRHYSENMANHTVNALEYMIDEEVRCGAHWTSDEIEKATKDMRFNPKVNRWDRYVAFNTMYASLCSDFKDEDIIKAAYLFFFCDAGWQSEDDCTKVWDYTAMRAKG